MNTSWPGGRQRLIIIMVIIMIDNPDMLDSCISQGFHICQCNNYLTRFNKIATQGAPQMAVDKEANSLSRVYSYYSKFNLRLFYV